MAPIGRELSLLEYSYTPVKIWTFACSSDVLHKDLLLNIYKPTPPSNPIQNMNVHPFKSILKANRGYVCLSCLVKQSAPRYRQDHRYQSTTTEPTPSSTTESGVAVEGVAWGRHQRQPLKDALLSKSNSHDKPPNKQQHGEASSAKDSNSENNAGIRDNKAQAAKQKTKPKNDGKDMHKPTLASDATASAVDPIEDIVDSGEISHTGSSRKASIPPSTAAKTKKGRRRKMADRKKNRNAGQGAVRAKPSSNTSGATPSLTGKIEDKEGAQSSEQSEEAILALTTEGVIPKNNQDQSSSTPVQTPLTGEVMSTGPAPAAKSVVRQTVARGGIRSIRRAAQLLGSANGEKRKAWEERRLRVEEARLKLKKSLEAAVEAQKATLKEEEKAVKTIEAKAKRPRKVRASPTR